MTRQLPTPLHAPEVERIISDAVDARFGQPEPPAPTPASAAPTQTEEQCSQCALAGITPLRLWQQNGALSCALHGYQPRPAPLGQLSATCGAPHRPRKPAPSQQPALLDECQPDALTAFDGTVYRQLPIMAVGSEDAPACQCDDSDLLYCTQMGCQCACHDSTRGMSAMDAAAELAARGLAPMGGGSAYIVDQAHIDALVCASISIQHPLSWYDVDPDTLPTYDDYAAYCREVRPHYRTSTHDQANRIGAMLWCENLASVAARYPQDASGDRPGPCDLTDAQIAAYTYAFHTRRREPVAILKALDSYEYQASEHPNWKRSEAYAFCQALRHKMIGALPGYDEAEWEISA